MFLLPARVGGLGISDPVDFAPSDYSSLREGAAVVVDCIREGSSLDVSAHFTQLACAHNAVNSSKDSHFRLQCCPLCLRQLVGSSEGRLTTRHQDG